MTKTIHVPCWIKWNRTFCTHMTPQKPQNVKIKLKHMKEHYSKRICFDSARSFLPMRNSNDESSGTTITTMMAMIVVTKIIMQQVQQWQPWHLRWRRRRVNNIVKEGEGGKEIEGIQAHICFTPMPACPGQCGTASQLVAMASTRALSRWMLFKLSLNDDWDTINLSKDSQYDVLKVWI